MQVRASRGLVAQRAPWAASCRNLRQPPCTPVLQTKRLVVCASIGGGDNAATSARRSLLLAPLVLQPLAAFLSPPASRADSELATAPGTATAPTTEVAPDTATYSINPAVELKQSVEPVAASGPAGAPIPTDALKDNILAYEFQYPLATSSGRPLKLTLARPPEKYSSAAPLTADARQRIVSELLDFNNYVTISVTVGPASGVLKDIPPEQWKAKDVALTVLIDRSTSRMSTGQRFALNDVEEAKREVRDGDQLFWLYEHRSQGSPTVSRPTAKETYRHALAATTYRRGLSGEPYLFTLNLGCQEELWPELKEPFRAAIQSFRLTELTDRYVPPDKNPWLFF